jgi:catechol 2,3-dioxygenase
MMMDGEKSARVELEYGIVPPDFRLPAASHVGVVRLQVSELERSLDYYGQVIGLRTLHADGDRVVLAAHGDDAPLVELRERRGASPVPNSGRLGLYHFAILLPDRASLGRFVTHLSSVGARAGASHHLVSEALYLQDPDGLGIEVYADLPREGWRHHDRQLEMDSRPLDLPDLVRAGAGEPWQGIPAGTVIGHVHLHVGDLERASRFYHEAIGLDRMVWSYPGALFLAAGGYHHHLGVNSWAAHAAIPRDEDARLLEWELVVPTTRDVREVAASLTARGYAADSAGDEITAVDPWGTRVRIRASGDPAPVPAS